MSASETLPVLATPRQAVLCYLLAESEAQWHHWTTAKRNYPLNSPRRRILAARAAFWERQGNKIAEELFATTHIEHARALYNAALRASITLYHS